jgi:signal transduction histidine kinase
MLRGSAGDHSPDEVDGLLRRVLAELRDVAHGIYPAALAEEGLAAAIESLAQTSPTEIDIRALPSERLEPPVEAAAYFVIAEALRRTHAQHATVSATTEGRRLLVQVDADRPPEGALIDLHDRVGAFDGILEVSAHSGLRLHAELPCA